MIPKIPRRPHRVAWLLLALAIPLTAGAAEEPRYGEWRGAQTKVDRMVEELQNLVDEARRSRAGHPAFLDDLQALVDRHRVPRRTVFLEDGFDDWNLSANPAWEVLSGEFNVGSDGAWLRTRQPVEAPERSGRTQQEADPASQLVFGILNELAREGRDEPPRAGDDNGPRRAAISTAAEIGNAFTLQFKMRSRDNRRGEVHFGLYQGDRLRSGYRMVYRAGGEGLQLVVFRRGRPEVLAEATTRGLDLDDDRDHVVTWTRDGEGRMTVGVDGVERLRATDRSYREPFAGLVLVNAGGHYWFDDFLLYNER